MNLPPRCQDDGKRISSSCDGITSTWSSAGCGWLDGISCLTRSVIHAIGYWVRYTRPCWLWLKVPKLTQRYRDIDPPTPFASSDLANRVAEALDARNRDPNAHVIDRILREAGTSPAPPRVLMLEQVLVGLPYLVTLVLVFEDRLEVVTNWTRPGGPWPADRPSLVRLVFRGQDMPVVPDGAFDSAPPGFGGRASIEDGVLDSLTVGVAGSLPDRPTRLYGVSARPPASDEDRDRWEAIGHFKQLRNELLHEGRASSIEALGDD